MLDIAQRQKDSFVGVAAKVFLILDGVDLLIREDCDDLFWLPEYVVLPSE